MRANAEVRIRLPCGGRPSGNLGRRAAYFAEGGRLHWREETKRGTSTEALTMGAVRFESCEGMSQEKRWYHPLHGWVQDLKEA